MVEASDSKVESAKQFLSTAKRGRYMLSYLQFGGTYRDHDVLSVHKVVDRDGDLIPGYFAVKVVFDWESPFGRNSTTATLFYNGSGTLYDVDAKTTSYVEPFDLANASIQILGNLLLEALRDQIKPEDRQQLQRLIHKADAKGLMMFGLNLQKGLGL